MRVAISHPCNGRGHNVRGWGLVRGTIRGFVTGTARGGEWALGGDLDLAAVLHSLAKDVSVVGALLRVTYKFSGCAEYVRR